MSKGVEPRVSSTDVYNTLRQERTGRYMERPATCTVQHTEHDCCSRSGRVASAWTCVLHAAPLSRSLRTHPINIRPPSSLVDVLASIHDNTLKTTDAAGVCGNGMDWCSRLNANVRRVHMKRARTCAARTLDAPECSRTASTTSRRPHRTTTRARAHAARRPAQTRGERIACSQTAGTTTRAS